MLFGLPIAQIVLFGFALTNEIEDSRMVICDYAQDEVSQQITDQLIASRSFILDRTLLDEGQIEAAFHAGDIKLAVVFPSDFGRQLKHQGSTTLQIIADASDPNTASTLSSYVQSIVADYQQQLLPAGTGTVRIEPEIRMLYNPELKGATNFVPGVMALVLLLVCVLMTSVSIVREKERGTMEVLLVSPMNPFTVIVAKAVPYFLLSLINLTVILVMSVWLLDMPLHGSLALLYLESSILILCALSLGLLISNSTRSQQAAMLISLMGMLLPTMMFTGFLFPLENMPWPLQWFANLVPSKWYYIIVKSIMIKGLGMAAIWKETLILAVMTLVLLAISLRRFNIRLA
jgi:ABC-2 type transport system permease protein